MQRPACHHFDVIKESNKQVRVFPCRHFEYRVGTRAGGLPYKNDGGARRTFLGVTNVVLVPFRVFSFKTSSVVAFVVPVRVEIEIYDSAF